MNLLLDSHILLWYADADSRLTEAAISSIQNARELYFSVASIWELSLKMHAGKLKRRDIQAMALHLGCSLISIAPEHVAAIVELPRLHGDPFDHILLAQANLVGLTLMTHDRILSEYGVPVLLV